MARAIGSALSVFQVCSSVFLVDLGSLKGTLAVCCSLLLGFVVLDSTIPRGGEELFCWHVHNYPP